jgi:diguanylate cyclase (GGDEF)-like protein
MIDDLQPSKLTKLNLIRDTYPDMLLLLSTDIIVTDMFYSAGFEDILIDVNHIQMQQPIEFLLDSDLTALIRHRIEVFQTNKKFQHFHFSSNREKTYEIRLIPEKKASNTNFICLIRDVSELIKSKNSLQYMVSHDNLTGLPNRSNYYETLNEIIKDSSNSDHLCGIIFFDLDRFKSVNDSLGHRIGDELLVVISRRLENNLKSNEFIARISGDEFIIIVKNVLDESEIIETAKRIFSMFKFAFELEDHIIEVKSSFGISIYPKHSKDPDILTQYADTAMYQAKELGGNQIVQFNERQNSQVKRNFQIDQNLRRAIANDELYLVYQPQFDIKTKGIVGLEALVRWKSSNGKYVAPQFFIPIAELTGYINELGLWIINTACFQISDWKKNKINFKKVAINLSRSQLIDPDLVSSIFSIMKFHGVLSSEIVFEITEDSIIKNKKLALKNLKSLSDVGISIAIDDFGSGYSSFVDLKKFPIKELKIDKSIIDDIGRETSNDAIIRAIIALGKELGLQIVAEGVETKTQFDFLKKNNCHIVQGYYLGEPETFSFTERMLKAKK